MRYNDHPAGYFLKDKEALLNSAGSDFKGKGKLVGPTVKIWKDGYEGREANVVLNGGYKTKVRFFTRGNRVYVLVKQVNQTDKNGDQGNAFFDSFQFLPYEEPNYYTYRPDGGNFTAQLVSPPKILKDSTHNYTSYLTNTVTCYSTNPKSGGLYGFEYSKISPYYRTDHVDSLYKDLINMLVTYQDSLIKTDTVLIDGKKAREIITATTATGVKSRNRILIDNDDVFFLVSHLDSSEMFNKASDVFYNSLTITHPGKANADIFSSKAQKICSDLQSTDTVVYKQALGAISYYKFTKDELPHIYEALRKNYPDDTADNGARHKLIRQLHDLNDSSTVNNLVDIYKKLGDRDLLKATVLSALPVIDKKNGYDIYLKLLTADKPLKIKELYQMFRPLNDSIQVAAANFDKLLPLIKYDNYRNYILMLAKKMAYKDTIVFDKILKTNYQSIMAYAMADVDSYLLLKDSVNNDQRGNMYNYLQLMNKVKFEPVNDQFTKHYIAKDPKGMYLPEAVNARIANHLTVSPALVNKLMDSLGTRYDIMEAFDKAGQQVKIPLKYKNQDAFARLCLYQYIAGDDYGNPENITLLGTVSKKGAVYYVYKYRLPDEEDEKKEMLIGICGPYKPGSTQLDFKKYNVHSDFEKVKSNWREQASKIIETLEKKGR